MYRVGDRVKVTVDAGSFQLKDAPATIFYIDNKNINAHHFHPIQVELDEPYDDSGQRMLRVSKKAVNLLE